MPPLPALDALLPPLAFFGMGDTEVLLVMVAVLIFFGGDKMPDFARGLGKAMRELKKATGDVEREFKRVIDEAEHPSSPSPFAKPPVPEAVSRSELQAAPAAQPGPPAAPAPAANPVEPPAPIPPDPGREFHSDI